MAQRGDESCVTRSACRIHRHDTLAGYTICKSLEQRMTAWLCLLLAGALEVVWALGLKQSDGFTRLWPSLGTLMAIALSFALMSVALRTVPFGTAYAVWTGIGAVGTVILGISMFGEPADFARLMCIGLIVAGIVGLKLVT